jgi:protein translocase SecG subunit
VLSSSGRMATVLPYIQIILSVLLVAGILSQTSSAGLGSAFGGADSVDAGLHTRRGPERAIFLGTLVIAALFVVVSFLSFLA